MCARATAGWWTSIWRSFLIRVNHDRLMSAVARRIGDKRMLKLIRGFLEAGVMEGGLVSPVDEGTPQGGPLSPLLSNLVLDELDRELERRGHRFARYADDCNIYVRSERAGQLPITENRPELERVQDRQDLARATPTGPAPLAVPPAGIRWR